MTKFQAGTIHTSHNMDCQVHSIGKAIRPFLQIWSHKFIIIAMIVIVSTSMHVVYFLIIGK